MEDRKGKVITFYSYKGGAGRSMALANTACLLSRRPEVTRGVLTVDWDLEAPGLHYYFPNTRPSITSPGEFAARGGVLEFFEQLNQRVQDSHSANGLTDEYAEGIVSELRLRDFALNTSVARVSLLPAGQFTNKYSDRVNSFDWRSLFARAPHIFRVVADYLANIYDYVLIDSRTGLNDTSNICTALIPDQIVLVFTPSKQNLDGLINT